MDYDDDYGFNPFMPGFGHVMYSILSGIFAIFCLLVIAGLIFLLVRFLLVGTKAAQLYVARNSPSAPITTTDTTPPTTGPAGTSAASTETRSAAVPADPTLTAPTTPLPKSARTSRTPKNPPTT